MRYLKTFENFEIGDNTNIGIIQDKTDTQYQINNNWFHHSIVKPSDKKHNEPLRNRGRINPNLVIPAFSNHIYPEKLEKYIDVFKAELLENDFPPIKGYPIILTTHDIERFETFLNGNDISTSDIGKYVWIVTDGFHRTLAAIEADIPYILTEVDYSYVDESDYVNESISIKYKKIVEKNNEDNIEIIAYHNNKKIGSVSIEILYDSYGYEFDDVFDEDEFNELFSDDSIVKISHIVVDNEYKNSGVGSELMKRAMKLMKKEGYTQFYLNACPMGYEGLRLNDLVDFYKKFGFEEILHQGGNVLMKCCEN